MQFVTQSQIQTLSLSGLCYFADGVFVGCFVFLLMKFSTSLHSSLAACRGKICAFKNPCFSVCVLIWVWEPDPDKHAKHFSNMSAISVQWKQLEWQCGNNFFAVNWKRFQSLFLPDIQQCAFIFYPSTWKEQDQLKLFLKCKLV